MQVHIALLGRTQDPVLKGFQAYPMDKLYILHSQDSKREKFESIAREVKSKLAAFGFVNVELRSIDSFDMRNIIDTILEIKELERSADIHVNITGGTNLMAGAACSASYFIGARAYYIHDSRQLPAGTPVKNLVIELPIPRLPYIKSLKRLQLQILNRLIESDGCMLNSGLRTDLKIAPQVLSYNVRILEEKGLVTVTPNKKDRRAKDIGLTEYGRMAALWTKP